ncbi:ribonuclease H-like domain-containing protein, partial [Tanacetum coccineum]
MNVSCSEASRLRRLARYNEIESVFDLNVLPSCDTLRCVISIVCSSESETCAFHMSTRAAELERSVVRFVLVLRESSNFFEESVEKRLGKETANESHSKHIRNCELQNPRVRSEQDMSQLAMKILECRLILMSLEEMDPENGKGGHASHEGVLDSLKEEGRNMNFNGQEMLALIRPKLMEMLQEGLLPVETLQMPWVVQDGIGGSSKFIQAQCRMRLKRKIISNDRFKKVEGYHAVPPPYTGNYMPSRPDLSFAGLDDSVYKTNVCETISSVPRIESTASKSSKDSLEQPKNVRPSAPIIEEYEYDNDVDFATNSGLVPVNAAKQSSPRAAASISTARHVNIAASKPKGNPQYALQDRGIFDSGCSRHMTGNKSYLIDYKDIDGGFVAFAGSPKGGKITSKGKIRTRKLDFEDVYFVKELKFNLFSVSQMCDKKNSVLFIETECLVLSPDFKLLDESQVLLKVPRQNNMYNFDRKNVVPSGGIKREFRCCRLTRQNGVVEEVNIGNLIEAARTILADSLLPTTFWDEAVNTACYVQNRVLVTKPNNKTPYELLLVTAGNQTNGDAGIETNVNAGQSRQEKASDHDIHYATTHVVSILHSLQVTLGSIDDQGCDDGYRRIAELDSLLVQQKEGYANNTNRDSTTSPSVSTVGPSINTASENINTGSPNINIASPIPNDSSMQSLENIGIFDDAYDDREVGAEADLNNLETTINVRPIPITRIHKDHPKDQIIRDINSATQTRRMTKISKEHAMTLVDLLKGKKAILTKWLYRNKKDERGIVVRNKARLVAQGYIQEEGFDYDEVFAPVARIEAIRLFFTYASFMGFIVYQMDVNSAFLYGTIEEEVYVCQPPGFKDPQFPNKVYKVEKLFMVYIKLLELDMRPYDAQEIPDEFYGGAHFLLRTANTPTETNKALIKDEEAKNVDVHLYRSMIGPLMYLTASRPDIMFAVCACARFQVTPKTSHLHAVKRIFRY